MRGKFRILCAILRVSAAVEKLQLANIDNVEFSHTCEGYKLVFNLYMLLYVSLPCMLEGPVWFCSVNLLSYSFLTARIKDLSSMGSIRFFALNSLYFWTYGFKRTIWCIFNAFLHTNLCYVSEVLGSDEPAAAMLFPPLLLNAIKGGENASEILSCVVSDVFLPVATSSIVLCDTISF